ncbi:L-type lectin-domain containing receptor kinase SIT2-like [Miscanthus floridulus]|uniref:L-type lectin-domain containing receptor kinase SIT2-like n=1 Tax=Miscanthus floridulus TaxID=154761 RepID=UPI0034590B0C
MVTQSGLLDLSSGTTNLKGHALYPTPLHFRKTPGGKVQSFSACFVFSIVNTYPLLSDDGMAFFIAPANHNFTEATPGMFFGLLNSKNNGKSSNRIFAVELDTYQNSELHDINDNHVGIDINGVSSLSSAVAGFYDDESGGGFKNLTLNDHREMQLWVDYDEGTTQINVTLAELGVAKPSRPLLSATYDLSTVLEDPAYIGFSATAGPINVRDYVLGWSFGMNRPASPIDVSKLPKLPHVGPKHRSKLLEIILPVATAVFILTLGTVIAMLVLRRRRYAEVREDWEAEFGPHRFSYKELWRATSGFKRKHLLGEGGFGKVYKGVLPVPGSSNNMDIAVKSMSHESRQGMREFISEVVSIGKLRHRNLVQLLGYCRRKGELFLVYDYMANGSLDKYIHCNRNNKPTLNWSQRFQVIKGIASALLYLHEKWDKVVIHRDIKASNVLLDHEMNGRLGDFGLARLYDHGTDPQTTHMVGTMGYLAPELVRTGKASTHTDVFAFGMFLLEVTCGKRPMMQSTSTEGDDHQFFLVDWVLEHWKNGSLTKTVDRRVLDNDGYNADEACTVLKIGLLCLHPFPCSRPSMRKIMEYLDGDMPLPVLTPTKLNINVVRVMQSNAFSPSVMSYPQLTSSFGTMSDLSGGR